jgi:hypothetical protein
MPKMNSTTSSKAAPPASPTTNKRAYVGLSNFRCMNHITTSANFTTESPISVGTSAPPTST